MFQISASDATSWAEFNKWCISHLTGGEDIKLMVQQMEHCKEVRVTMTPLGALLLEFRSLKEFVYLFLTVVDGKLSPLCAPLA